MPDQVDRPTVDATLVPSPTFDPVAEEARARAEIRQRVEDEERARAVIRRQVEEEMRLSQPQAPTLVGAPGAQQQQVIINNIIQPAARPTLGFFIRMLYFIFLGWYVGTVWLVVALLFCISVIGLPIGVLMLSKSVQAYFLW